MAQKTVKAQPIGKYRRSQGQTSGWTKKTMVASKILRHPYNFDFSKNKEYRAPRIAGGKKKKRIENTLLTDGSSVAPNDAARGNSITANTIRARLIVPTAESRNRNDSQLHICTEARTEWQDEEPIHWEWPIEGVSYTTPPSIANSALGIPNDYVASFCSLPSFWRFRGRNVLQSRQGKPRTRATVKGKQPQRLGHLDRRTGSTEMKKTLPW
jgi:hypothetical protein